MERKRGEVSKLTGISKRTLQIYDEEGLVKPRRNSSNYSVYTDEDLFRLFIVRVFREELGYTSKETADIVNSDDFDIAVSLDHQIEQLKERKRHIENQITAAQKVRDFVSDPPKVTAGEIIAAMMRHPEYGWLYAIYEDDEDSGEEAKKLREYMTSSQPLYKKMATGDPDEASEGFRELLEKADEFSPSTKPFIGLSLRLSEMYENEVPPESHAPQEAVDAARKQIGQVAGKDPIPTLYIIGKYLGTGALTPKPLEDSLSEEELEASRKLWQYMAHAVSYYVESQDMTEEQRREIEDLNSWPDSGTADESANKGKD